MAKRKTPTKKAKKVRRSAAPAGEPIHYRGPAVEPDRLTVAELEDVARMLVFLEALAKGAPHVYLEATLGRGNVATVADFERPSEDGFKRAERLLDLLEDTERLLGRYLETRERQAELPLKGPQSEEGADA